MARQKVHDHQGWNIRALFLCAHEFPSSLLTEQTKDFGDKFFLGQERTCFIFHSAAGYKLYELPTKMSVDKARVTLPAGYHGNAR